MLEGDLIKSALARRLGALFPGITVYKEKVEQGLKYPSFFILQLAVNKEDDLRPFQWLNFQMNIRYRPTRDYNSKRSELDQLGLDMMDGLETVEVDGKPLRGRDVNYQIIDGVLQFFINFRMRVKREQEDGEKMLVLENSAYIKEEE